MEPIRDVTPEAIRGRRKLPSEKAIRAFWAPLLWRVKGFRSPTGFARSSGCFACKLSEWGVEKAHIESRCYAGSDGPENLHLLCPACHQDSEMIHGQLYWLWLLFRTKRDGQMAWAMRTGLNPTAVARLNGGKSAPQDQLFYWARLGQDFRCKRVSAD